ncbi:MAG: hypothetical protein JXB47_18470 [Anaerolineae bacterium]|nr:hypothetical protein [Anaerolineae bacterium]
MTDSTSKFIHWEPIGAPALYHYRGFIGGPVAVPALLVAASDQSPALWDVLGVYLMTDGFRHIYACHLPDSSPTLALMRTVERVLSEARAEWLVILAYGRAADAALRYIETQAGYRKAPVLVALNGDYQRNALSYLEGRLLQLDEVAAGGREPAHDARPTSPEVADQFVMINVYGQAPTSYLKPDRIILPLPEAINIGLNLHPKHLLEAPELYNDHLRPYLLGGVWTIQLHLRGFQMRPGAPEAPVGQFYFEVDQQRVPPEGMFAPPDTSEYTFEDHYTPLGTVALPAKQALQAANINFRLREVGRSMPKRRRTLTTTLHVPLVEGKPIDHVMQDSFGSEIRLRVHCMRTPAIIPADK